MKITNIFTAILTLSLLSAPSLASVIAVIDSGTDLNHSMLSSKKWSNSVDIDDAVDNDDNGYIDDVHGWNFADGNNKLFEKQYVGTFSEDTYRFFEVQTRMLKGEATEADRQWMQEARQNQKLLAELSVFGNFVHGTHVAGIAAQGTDAAEVMVLKIIPTKSPITPKSFMKVYQRLSSNAAFHQPNGDRSKLIRTALKLLASQQAKTLKTFGTYVGKKEARLANCSFGTSTRAASMILTPILKLALGRDATDEEVLEYSKFFVSQILKASEVMVTSAPDTLFVIAAGNDGANNDELPTSPANLKFDNSISVGATLGYQKLASFSNYGVGMVDVAAPGVGIRSSIPGEEMLVVSGTSQAAPFVTSVANQALAENPSLSNSDLRELLMKTSDQKLFLKEKIRSGGVVNFKRAIQAAKLAMTMDLSKAIQSSLLQVNDMESELFQVPSSSDEDYEGYVLPLPSLI